MKNSENFLRYFKKIVSQTTDEDFFVSCDQKLLLRRLLSSEFQGLGIVG